MKKIICSLLLALALISCEKTKTSNPTDPEIPDTTFTEISYLCGQYVGHLVEDDTTSPEYYQFMFTDGGVTLDEEGYFVGSGEVYLFTILAPSKDEDFFPAPGLYLGNDSLLANTFFCTDNPIANGYAAIYTINDGSIDHDKTLRFSTGLITIIGDAELADFLFMLEDANSEEHYLHCLGAAPIEIVE